jgi:hypothetical protein
MRLASLKYFYPIEKNILRSDFSDLFLNYNRLGIRLKNEFNFFKTLSDKKSNISIIMDRKEIINQFRLSFFELTGQKIFVTYDDLVSKRDVLNTTQEKLRMVWNELEEGFFLAHHNMMLIEEYGKKVKENTFLDFKKAMDIFILPKNLENKNIEIGFSFFYGMDPWLHFSFSFEVPQERSYYFCLGSFKGDSFSDSMIIPYLKASFHSFKDKEYLNLENKLIQIAEKFNDIMFEYINSRKVHISMVLVSVNLFSGCYTLLNAGHSHPFYFMSKEKKLSPLVSIGSCLGFSRNPHFMCYYGQMLPSDFLVIYTDGVFENSNEKNEKYTLSEFSNLILAHQNDKAQEMTDSLLLKGRFFWGKEDYSLKSTAIFSFCFLKSMQPQETKTL